MNIPIKTILFIFPMFSRGTWFWPIPICLDRCTLNKKYRYQYQYIYIYIYVVSIHTYTCRVFIWFGRDIFFPSVVLTQSLSYTRQQWTPHPAAAGPWGLPQDGWCGATNLHLKQRAGRTELGGTPPNQKWHKEKMERDSVLDGGMPFEAPQEFVTASCTVELEVNQAEKNNRVKNRGLPARRWWPLLAQACQDGDGIWHGQCRALYLYSRVSL